MSGSSKKIIWGTAVMGVVLVVAVAFVTGRTQSVRLANGTELSFVAMTRGPTNTCFPGGIWDRLKYRFLPANGIGVGRFKIVPVAPLVEVAHYVEDGRVAFPNKAVVWIRHRGGPGAPMLPVNEERIFLDVRATIADEKGEEWEMRTTQIPRRPLSTDILDSVSPWSFPAFPRRGKVLTFRIYTRNNSDQWDTLAEFKMRNPTPGPHPLWEPMNLPVTRTSGDLEVSLTEATSGARALDWMPKDQRPYTRLRFRVKEKGQPTDVWLPDRMEATDATGNEADFPVINYASTIGVLSYVAQGVSLSPSEVWRLRMRLTRQKDFPPDRVWTSPGLAVMRNGPLLSANLKTNFQSGELTVMCLDRNIIRLKLMPTPKDARVHLVGIVDDRGAKVEHTRRSFGDYQFDAQCQIPPDAESIRITIGLAEMRHFEFLAQPVRQ